MPPDQAASTLGDPTLGIQAGAQLGSFEITSLLGKGGMGEVYRARDAKLKRDVAIKILPEEFSRDPERVGRFQREAEALAALNHQNIAGIHDVQQSGTTRFLVLEYVEGETLADIIDRRGALPIDEALQIAKQMVEALEAAHEKGIVHRDLKPANVKIAPDGKVKVLDFGLAKALESVPTGAALANSPTLVSASMPGVILGTAAYMSPEQAKGRTVDRRTDIFAFGCVLYEMITGRPAFDGEDVPDILSRVLQREPDWTRMPTNAPPSIHRLARLCLEKDLNKRRQSAGDVRVDIEHALAEPMTPAAAVPSSRGIRLAWTVAAVALVVAVALAVPAARYLRETPTLPPEMRVDITTPPTSSPFHFSLSPDGRRVAFVASGDGQPRLWVRPLDAVTAQPLAGTENAEYPFWSPDSRSVGFFANGKLKRIDSAGGPPQTVTDAAAGRGGSWNADGTILFAPSNTDPLWRVSAGGGNPTVVTRVVPGQVSHRFPQFLPDGRRFLFFVQGAIETAGIYLSSLDGEEPRSLVVNDSAGAWTLPGWLFFVRQGALVARPFDAKKGEFAGELVTVADPVGFDPGFNLGGFSVSATGLVAYRPGGSDRRQLTWFARDGKLLRTVAPADQNNLNFPELSPNGQRVAVQRALPNNDVWLIDLVRGSPNRFTFNASLDGAPLWSPDGSRIVFRTNRKGTYDLYLKPSSGAGSEELLWASAGPKMPLSWSSDGRLLLFWETNSNTNFDLLTLPMVGERKPSPFLNTQFTETNGQFSPDGRWVAYQSNESGPFEIYVQPFPPTGAKWQISTNTGTMPRWRADSKELYFIASDLKMMAAAITTSGSTLEGAPPIELFQTHIAAGFNQLLKHQYTVSPDGRFLIVETVESNASPITLILNWHPPK